MSALRRRSGPSAKDFTLPADACCPVELLDVEVLKDFLFQVKWPEDGASRATGTVLLFAEGGRLKAMLNDKDGGVVAFISLDGAVGVFEQLDKALTSPVTDWRPSKGQGGRR